MPLPHCRKFGGDKLDMAEQLNKAFPLNTYPVTVVTPDGGLAVSSGSSLVRTSSCMTGVTGLALPAAYPSHSRLTPDPPPCTANGTASLPAVQVQAHRPLDGGQGVCIQAPPPRPLVLPPDWCVAACWWGLAGGCDGMEVSCGCSA